MKIARALSCGIRSRSKISSSGTKASNIVKIGERSLTQVREYSQYSKFHETKKFDRFIPKSESAILLSVFAVMSVAVAILLYIDHKNETNERNELLKIKYPNNIIRGNSEELVDESCNLLEYPTERDYAFDKKCQLTIGDLHGNALKLFYFLIRQNVIESNEKDYLKFSELYRKNIDDVTKEDLEEFNAILTRVRCSKAPKGAMVRLIGDELADRGCNDFFTLKFLGKLSENHIPYEIIFSNHGFEFISAYEKGLEGHTSYLEKRQQAISLTHLRDLVTKKLVTMEEIDNLIKKAYQPHLKVLSCSYQAYPASVHRVLNIFSKYSRSIFCEDVSKLIDDWLPRQRITIYSHAPIGLETIKSLAMHKTFNVDYCDETVKDMVKTIEKINEKFSLIVLNNEVSSTFVSEIYSKDSTTDIPLTYPLRRCIWSRKHQEKDLPINRLHAFELFHVHGHDGAGKIDARFKDFITNLDNHLGKGSNSNKKKYSILYSHETCSK